MNREEYCKDCQRSIWGENPDCDVNIENNGRYTGSAECYCKITNGKMAEEYSFKHTEGKGK